MKSVMRWGAIFLVGGLLATLVVVPASAYCAQYTLAVSPRAVEQGDEITVSGQHWFVCDDIGGGCQGRHEDVDDPVVRPSVEIVRADGESVELVSQAQTNGSGTFNARFTVPPSLPPGQYEVVAKGNGASIRVPVVILPRR